MTLEWVCYATKIAVQRKKIFAWLGEIDIVDKHELYERMGRPHTRMGSNALYSAFRFSTLGLPVCAVKCALMMHTVVELNTVRERAIAPLLP